MRSMVINAIWRAEHVAEAIGLIGSILVACTIGTLIAAAGMDLDHLARQTAVLSFLSMLTFGVRAVFLRRDPIITGIVGIGIGQGILYFFTDAPDQSLSILCDIMIILTTIYLTKGKSK